MHVSEILRSKSSDVKSVRPHETIEAVACCLRIERIGAVVVKNPNDSVAGILSERDIVRGLVDYGPRVISMTVAELMTEDPVTCASDDTIADVAKIMTQRRIRHIPVVSDGQLLGIVSIGDVVKHRMEEMELERNVLMDIASTAH